MDISDKANLSKCKNSHKLVRKIQAIVTDIKVNNMNRNSQMSKCK